MRLSLMPRLKRCLVSGCAGVHVLWICCYWMTELTGGRICHSLVTSHRHQGQERGESKRDAGEKCLSALYHVYIILQDKLAGSFRKRKALFTISPHGGSFLSFWFFMLRFSCYFGDDFPPNRQMLSSIIANIWYHVPSVFEFSLSFSRFELVKLS